MARLPDAAGPEALTAPPEALVVGAASIDRLHLVSGEVATAPGGAGLYTALALSRSGVATALFAPRPEPPAEALAVACAGLRLAGPTVPAGELPRLEIAHHGEGRATLLAAAWGAARNLEPDAVPAWAARAGSVHAAALPSPDQQARFCHWARRAGAARVSAGTFARAIEADAAGVRRVLEGSDVFFMNENEARRLFGSLEAATGPRGGTLFVTRGRLGTRVVEGSRSSDVPAVEAPEVDPTGAGDTFCGAALAALMHGADAVEAARAGVRLAATVIAAVGPAALLGFDAGPSAPPA